MNLHNDIAEIVQKAIQAFRKGEAPRRDVEVYSKLMENNEGTSCDQPLIEWGIKTQLRSAGQRALEHVCKKNGLFWEDVGNGHAYVIEVQLRPHIREILTKRKEIFMQKWIALGEEILKDI